MTPEQFIKKNIVDYCDAIPGIKDAILEKALERYRRNQFFCATDIISDAREELELQTLLHSNDLKNGITAKDFAEKHGLSYRKALHLLKANAIPCLQKGPNGAIIYRYFK